MLRRFLLTALAAVCFPIDGPAAGELSYGEVSPFDIQLPTYMGRPEETVAKAEAAIAGLRPADDPLTINLIGQIFVFLCEARTELRQYEQAEAACLEAVATFEGISAVDPAANAYNATFALPQLARTYEAMGDLERALEVLERLLHRVDDRGSPNSKDVDLLTQVGELHVGLGRFRAAEAAFREAIATKASLWEHATLPVAMPHLKLASLYRLEERFAEAEKTLAESLAETKKVQARLAETNATYGLKSNELYRSTLQLQLLSQSLAWIHFEQGRLDKAWDLARTVLDYYESQGDMWTVFASDVLVLLGQIEDARNPRSPEAGRQLVSAITASKGGDHPAQVFRAIAQKALARHHLLTRNVVAAEPYARVALETLARLLGEDHYHTARARVILAGVLQQQGKHSEAVAQVQKAYATQQAYLPPYHSETGETLTLLAELYATLGQQENLRATESLISNHVAARAKFESEL